MSPIKPENRKKYPADWQEIRERILKRATDHFPDLVRCECAGHCGIDHQTVTGRCHEVNGRKPSTFLGKKVILTIAHQDHELVDHSDENLKAFCQKCHLRFDAIHRHEQRRLAKEAEED